MTELTTARDALKELLPEESNVAIYYRNGVCYVTLSKAKEIAIKLGITVEELIASEPEDDS